MQKPMFRKSVQLMLAALVTVWGASAWSNCACFCVEGQLTTMCTDAAEAQNAANLCPSSSSASCPQSFSTEGASTYDSPQEGAENCRDVKVYDAILGKYVTAKACDVI
ncbi:MAG: hypothetical protein AB7I04_20105 [Pseudomonadales bacterium]